MKLEGKRQSVKHAALLHRPSIGCYVKEEFANAYRIAKPDAPLPSKKRRFSRRVFTVLAMLVVGCAGLYFGFHRHLSANDSIFRFASDWSGKFVALVKFPVEQVHIVGHGHTAEKEIIDVLGAFWDMSLLAIDTQAAQTKIEQLPWVQRAIVERVFPHGLNVYIQERIPVGRLVTLNGTFVFDKSGYLIAPIGVGAFLDLAMYDGEEAPGSAPEIQSMLGGYSDIRSHIVRYSYVGRRRWTLYLRNDVEILLPELQVETALARLKALQDKHNILNRALKSIDLRLADRVTIQPKNSNTIKTIIGGVADNLHAGAGNQINKKAGVDGDRSAEQLGGI